MSSFDFSAANAQYGLPGKVEIVPGQLDLPKVRVTTHHGAVEIYLHGAQVVSWKPAGGEEVLFVSELSRWEDGRAIRGGIPICFPWFRGKSGDSKAPAHGLVRTRAWSLDSITESGNGEITVVLATSSKDWPQELWPYPCDVRYSVTAGNTLQLALQVRNTGTKAFQFEEALHTYFKVSDVRQVTVQGLDTVTYLDNFDGNREKVQQGEVKLSTQTDNAYLNTQTPLEIADPGLARRLVTAKSNSNTTVIWNPWVKGASAMADLGDQEWTSMLCVEASNIMNSAVELDPSAEHTLGAVLQVRPLER